MRLHDKPMFEIALIAKAMLFKGMCFIYFAVRPPGPLGMPKSSTPLQCLRRTVDIDAQSVAFPVSSSAPSILEIPIVRSMF